MAKVAKELSALAVSRIAKNGAHAVGGVAGLQLQIIGSSKVWVLRFALYGRRRRMGLGPYPAVSLASARDLARKAYDLIRNGHDPIDERQAKIDAQTVDSSTGMTFKRAAEQFIAAHESGWSNAKHRLQWVSTIPATRLATVQGRQPGIHGGKAAGFRGLQARQTRRCSARAAAATGKSSITTPSTPRKTTYPRMSTTMAKTQTLIYRRTTLLEKLGISKSTLRNWMLNEGFPPPIQLGPRAVGWKANNVDEWLESRPIVALAEALN